MNAERLELQCAKRDSRHMIKEIQATYPRRSPKDWKVKTIPEDLQQRQWKSLAQSMTQKWLSICLVEMVQRPSGYGRVGL